MSSAKNDPYASITRRTISLAVFLTVFIFIIDFFVFTNKTNTKKNEIITEAMHSDNKLLDELNRLIQGLEDDYRFFESVIGKNLGVSKKAPAILTLSEFLKTHSHYFKVRLTTLDGQEIFKLAQKESQLFNLSDQPFFQDLKDVEHGDFYFSSLEPNIINGVIELPVQPTVRVSKRVNLPDGRKALLIVNIDGTRILQIFNRTIDAGPLKLEKILADHTGHFIASYPYQKDGEYALNRQSLDAKLRKLISQTEKTQGHLDYKGRDTLVYTKLPLPRTSLEWLLVSEVPAVWVEDMVYKDILTIIFWEIFFLVVTISWYWRAERKRHQEGVVQVLLRERSEFIQDVSHQLKTPLAVISTYLENESSIRSHVGEMRKEVQGLIKIIEDLLLLSQADTFKEVKLQKENIVEIITESAELVGTKAKEKGVRIKINVEEGLFESLDALIKPVLPELLKSAFGNLLDNAIEYSPENGVIGILVSRVSDKIIIDFQDQGPGIPEELQHKIFNRFSRGSGAHYKGSGLGLAIVKKVMELNNGTIQLVPAKSGAWFRVTL